MNPSLRARWTELAPLIDEVLDIEPAQRIAAIGRLACDDTLRELLLELFSRDTASGFLDGNGSDYAGLLLQDEASPSPPARIGCYRIVRLLGEGGSSSVYLAERDADGYVQRVALKLLRIGLRDPLEQERFRRERRMLARLEHPNIARLLDGGFTDEGVPWFALEYVDGEPITAWCDARSLGLAARLRLFVEVCAAVAHAHRALIVHRDLKPANILVDAEGRPRLLDFGIAKLLDPTAPVDQTRTDARRLTPGYAAPEQFANGDITTATDVYGLGVLLHELLTGMRPERREDGIPLPSSVLVADRRGDAFAAARSTTQPALVRALRGDLDTILSKALAVDPSHRYSGAEALAADVARHLGRRPIQARRLSTTYRIARFLRRHRVAAVLSALVVISIGLGIAATLRESKHAHAAAAEALKEATRADAVKHFVLTLFGGVTPDESRGREISARELLERGEARMEETLAAHPELESELDVALAGAWRQLGAYDRAARLAEQAVKVANDAVANHAAQLELGAVRVAQGEFDAAETALRAALSLAPGASERSTAQRRLAELLAQRGHPQQAAQLLDAALAADHDDKSAYLDDLAALGRVRFGAGDLAGAETALRDALRQVRVAHGERHTQTAQVEHDLAVVLLQRGGNAEAADLLEAAIATRSVLLGERHPDLAQSRFNLAVARQRLGDLDSAGKLFRDALAQQRASLGPKHPDVASSLNSLAMLAYQKGDLNDAIATMSEALGVGRAAWGDAHPTVATMLGNLSGFERSAGRIDAAERDARAAVAATETALGPQHYLAGVARLGLAGALVEKGEEAQALDEQRRAITILEGGLGAQHVDVAQARGALADTLLHAGDVAGAAHELALAWAAQGIQSLSPEHPRRARLRLVALRLSVANGDCKGAADELPAVSAALGHGGAGLRAEQAGAEILLARCLRILGRTAEAAGAQARSDALIARLPYVPRRLREMQAEPQRLRKA